MRAVLAVLIVTAIVASGPAHAEPSLSQFGPTLQQAHDLAVACHVDVELRGAIADVEVRQRITNHASGELGAVQELELAPGAELIGLSAGGVAATPVGAAFTTQTADRELVGADPVIAQALQPSAKLRPRYRVIIEPIKPGGELEVVLRWTAIAEIRDGALHLQLPAMTEDDQRPACTGDLHAEAGPGVAIARLLVDGAEAHSFALASADVAIEARLAFAGAEPVVWTQSEALGDGYLARATTVLAPPQRARTGGRALLVIDGSRSMELVGRHRVVQLVRAIAKTLPADAQLEAIVFDRTAARVLGEWRPNTPATLEAIEAALARHVAGNGSDAVGAAALARQVLNAPERDQTMVITITDGAFGELPSQALVTAFDEKPTALDVHAIVLDPGRMHSAAADVLRAPAVLYGGTYIEVPVDDLDGALVELDTWLRPAWLGLSLGAGPKPGPDRSVTRGGSGPAAPYQLLAGSGVVAVQITRSASPLVLTGRTEKPFRIAARPGPSARIAQLSLAPAGLDEFAGPKDDTGERAERLRARLSLAHPAVDGEHALAVLATTGRVARDRRAMIQGGGPYNRIASVADPAFPPEVVVGNGAMIGGSAIDREILDRMFKLQLQPKAYACYERALVRAPHLAGTVTFHLDIGRGEVTRVTVDGLGDKAFDACLIDAGFGMAPPLPNPDFNIDDRTVANYPLTFSVRAEHPLVVAGDADSSEPLDIDAIPGGVPRPVKPVDASTPLGGLRPSPSPQ